MNTRDNMIEKCRLCLQYKDLLKKSHIIPDFMYGKIFSEDHFIYRVNLVDIKKTQRVPDGEYESGILCRDCDGVRIGQLESYARRIFYGGNLLKGETISFNIEKINDVVLHCLVGLDYVKLKLFLLSILWRASISQREIFRAVSLGPYEEEIRQMIFESMPGSKEKFPCIISRVPKDIGASVISEPIRNKNSGTTYNFLINDFNFIFFVSGKRLPEWGKGVILSEQGVLKIVVMPPESARKMLNRAFGKDIYKY